VDLRQQDDVVGEAVDIILGVNAPRGEIPEEDIDLPSGLFNLLGIFGVPLAPSSPARTWARS
jgi:hypothetical protein